jgi:hypothetical protein
LMVRKPFLRPYLAKRQITKKLLRGAARKIIEERRGFRVTVDQRPGAAFGARLLAVQGDQEFKIAVRTSTRREVGLMRRDDGHWRTIPSVDEVVVAVPSEDMTAIEVLGFDPDRMLEAFDAAFKSRKIIQSSDAPIFVALDAEMKKGSKSLAANLKAKAKWTEKLMLDAHTLSSIPKSDSSDGFIERIKREFAERNGVDVSKVIVEFRIVA